MIIVDEIDADLLDGAKVYRTHPEARTEYVHCRKKYGDPTKYMHRAVMERVVGRKLSRSEKVDHIDGNGLNNARSNLRIVSHSQNLANRPGWRQAASRFKGVTKSCGGRWAARIFPHGKNIWIGVYDTEEDAARAYDVAAVIHFGECAKLNFGASP